MRARLPLHILLLHTQAAVVNIDAPEKENYYLFIYEVITWEFFYKRSSIHCSECYQFVVLIS